MIGLFLGDTDFSEIVLKKIIKLAQYFGCEEYYSGFEIMGEKRTIKRNAIFSSNGIRWSNNSHNAILDFIKRADTYIEKNREFISNCYRRSGLRFNSGRSITASVPWWGHCTRGFRRQH